MEVTFYSQWEDSRLRFAVIAAWCGDGWLFCRHRERETYELPGGHREQGESVEEAARREFLEETAQRPLSWNRCVPIPSRGRTALARKVRKPLVCSFMRK